MQTINSQAVITYQSDVTVTNNNLTYKEWLGTPAGAGYASQIIALSLQVTQAQNVVDQLAKEQDTPNIHEALTAFTNQSYYTKLSDPNLSDFPAVPAWSLSTSSQQWVNQVQGGGGTGGSISFSNSAGSYSYEDTWAQSSLSVGGAFWSVYANRSWQEVSEFYEDSSLAVTISFKAWDTINIQPSRWYSGTTAFRNGPFLPNYTAYKQENSTAWMFRKSGIIPVFKTGMLVCYQPSFAITVSESTHKNFSQNWSAATGVGIGPFQIGGSAGGASLNWTRTGSSMTLKLESTSNIPLIFGVNVAVEPM